MWWDNQLDVCMIENQVFWNGKLNEMSTFTSECASFNTGNSEVWTMKWARNFEEGRFHTEKVSLLSVEWFDNLNEYQSSMA